MVFSYYNSSKLKEEDFRVYTIKKEWFALGIVTKETIFGNEVRTYDMERTICDILRARNKIDGAIISETFVSVIPWRSEESLPEGQ